MKTKAKKKTVVKKKTIAKKVVKKRGAAKTKTAEIKVIYDIGSWCGAMYVNNELVVTPRSGPVSYSDIVEYIEDYKSDLSDGCFEDEDVEPILSWPDTIKFAQLWKIPAFDEIVWEDIKWKEPGAWDGGNWTVVAADDRIGEYSDTPIGIALEKCIEHFEYAIKGMTNKQAKQFATTMIAESKRKSRARKSVSGDDAMCQITENIRAAAAKLTDKQTKWFLEALEHQIDEWKHGRGFGV